MGNNVTKVCSQCKELFSNKEKEDYPYLLNRIDSSDQTYNNDICDLSSNNLATHAQLQEILKNHAIDNVNDQNKVNHLLHIFLNHRCCCMVSRNKNEKNQSKNKNKNKNKTKNNGRVTNSKFSKFSKFSKCDMKMNHFLTFETQYTIESCFKSDCYDIDNKEDSLVCINSIENFKDKEKLNLYGIIEKQATIVTLNTKIVSNDNINAGSDTHSDCLYRHKCEIPLNAIVYDLHNLEIPSVIETMISTYLYEMSDEIGLAYPNIEYSNGDSSGHIFDSYKTSDNGSIEINIFRKHNEKQIKEKMFDVYFVNKIIEPFNNKIESFLKNNKFYLSKGSKMKKIEPNITFYFQQIENFKDEYRFSAMIDGFNNLNTNENITSYWCHSKKFYIPWYNNTNNNNNNNNNSNNNSDNNHSDNNNSDNNNNNNDNNNSVNDTSSANRYGRIWDININLNNYDFIRNDRLNGDKLFGVLYKSWNELDECQKSFLHKIVPYHDLTSRPYSYTKFKKSVMWLDL